MSATIGIKGDAALPGVPDGAESVFTLRTVRADGSDVAEADPVAGYLAPAGTSVRQVREAARDERVAVWFPSLPAEPAPEAEPDTTAELAALTTLLTASAPGGWQRLVVECEALGSRMAVTTMVTMADGAVRLWSPPAMAGQWLHRLRMRDYHPGRGVWFRLRLEFEPGTPPARHTDDRTPPSSLSEEDCADELRLLPRAADAVPRWLLDAAVRSEQAGRAAYAEDEEPPGAPVLVPLFDGRDEAGRPAWYRPVLGTREQAAVLAYLRDAPLVLSARGRARDELTGTDRTVPMGFHTDGWFVWPSAAAHYLREHGVPPALPLLERIRAARHRPPASLPAVVMDRAAALAMGRPWDAAEVTAQEEAALRPVESVLADKRIGPERYSPFAEREGAWCLLRDGDRYRVQWSLDRRRAVLFDDVAQAAAHLAGQLTVHAADLA